MTRRALKLTVSLVALLALATAAWAYWTTGGSGSAAGSVGTLNAATISAPATSTGSTTITWTQQATLPGSPAQDSSIVYRVERKLGVGTYAPIATGGCSGSLPHGTTTCTDTVTTSGSYAYRVVAEFATGSWTATSNEAGPVVTTVGPVDTTPPAVLSINRVGTSPTNASSLQFAVTFSEPVTGVDAADFALAASGVTSASITGVTGLGDSYTVTVNSGSGSGTLGVNLVDDDSIKDLVLNPLGGAGNGNGNFTGQEYTLDRTPPSVSSIARAVANPTNAASVSWTVTFSESVTGVDSADFALANTGLGGTPAITGVSGSGDTYTVTASTGSGNGSLGLNLVDDDTIADGLGQELGGSGNGNGDFTGEVYTVDRTAPTLSTLQAFDVDLDGKVDEVRATFNESLAASTATAPWTLSNVPSGGSLASVSTSGAVATLVLNEGAGSAATSWSTNSSGFRVVLAASAAGIRDLAGNQASFGSTSPADKAAPAPTLMEMRDTESTPDGRINQVQVTFSESLSSYSAGTAPWTLANVPSGGTLSSVSVSSPVVTLNITEGAGAKDTSVGSFTVALAANASGIRDSAANLTSFAAKAPTDDASPIITAVTDTNGSLDGKFEESDTLTLTFSEAVTNVGTSSSVVLDPDSGGDQISASGFLNGLVDMNGTNYITGSSNANFASSTLSQPAANQATLTLGACSSGACASVAQQGSAQTVDFEPATSITDAAGNPADGVFSLSLLVF